MKDFQEIQILKMGFKEEGLSCLSSDVLIVPWNATENKLLSKWF